MLWTVSSNNSQSYETWGLDKVRNIFRQDVKFYRVMNNSFLHRSVSTLVVKGMRLHTHFSKIRYVVRRRSTLSSFEVEKNIRKSIESRTIKSPCSFRQWSFNDKWFQIQEVGTMWSSSSYVITMLQHSVRTQRSNVTLERHTHTQRSNKTFEITR